MKSIRSYFSSKCDVSGASKDAGSFQVPCHVRQQGAEDQEMWNLVPSFLLQEDGGGGEVMGSISPAPWTCNITAPILKQDEKVS